MNTVTDQAINNYLTEFNQVANQLAGKNLPWLQQIKQKALAEFTTQGFPTARTEDWKYTNITPITKQKFNLHKSEIDDTLINSAIDRYQLADFPCYKLVFVDGYFASALSTTNNLPAGITMTNLAQALASDNPLIKTHLNQLAAQDSHAFKELNTLFIEDGAFIHLANNTHSKQPIYLLFISTGQNNSMNTLRNLIIADENSHATIIEHYISLEQNNYFTNSITELFLQRNAIINHYKLQEESKQAFHIGTLEVKQHEQSELTSHSFALGGSLVRSDINIDLAAERTNCTLNGLYLASGRQHIDHHTTIKHHKPHGNSRQYYKGVLTDRARAVFNGKVFVDPGAIKTNAQQTNKNLILSNEAEIDTKPQLEIYADDVQCTHGAAIGQLDADAFFYLKARGINDAQAHSLLIYAFIQELFQKISVLPLRQQMQQSSMHFLPVQVAIEEA